MNPNCHQTTSFEMRSNAGVCKSIRVRRYDILYRQSVGSQDVYLGLGEKDPGSRQCEEMVVEVVLPGVGGVSEIELEVKKQTIMVLTTKYKLSIYLPRPVDADKGKAEWVTAKDTLRVILPVIMLEPWEDI